MSTLRSIHLRRSSPHLHDMRSTAHLAHRGFSLVELMIAVTIGMLVLAGVGTVYLGSRQTFREQETLARMQEGARYAFEALSVDIRQAGFAECAPKNKTFSTLNGANWYNTLASQPLFGYESGAGLPAVVTGALANTDAVKVIRSDNSGDYSVQSHNAASAQFTLKANHDLKQGEILTIVTPDCSKAVTFQMTNVNNNNTISQVVHNSGAGTPGNSTKCLDDPSSAACSSPATYPDIPADSRIMRQIGRIYFLANNPNGQPALYRESLGPQGGVAGSTSEELVEGIEDMQIVYGEDTNADKNVDSYVAANAVANWDNVLAVRVSLLVRSVENNVVSSPVAVTFDGATVNSGVGADRRLRKVFTATIGVRNRF